MTGALTVTEARALIDWHLAAVDQLWEYLRVADPEVPKRRPSSTLTPQERRVASAYAVSGTALASVARDMHISPNTAKSHLRQAYRKLGAHDRGQLRRALLRAQQPAAEAAPVGVR